MPRAEIIAASLARRGALIRTRDLAEACAIANRIAPEHLELAVADPDALLPKIRHAGAIFVGHYASEALGDYCAGPNHVLPTGPHGALQVAARRLRFPEALERAADLGEPAAQALGRVAVTLAQRRGPDRARPSAEARLDKG